MSSSIFSLLSDKDVTKMISVRDKQKQNRTELLSKLENGINKDVALRAEQFFFTYIQLMDELLSDFLMCNQSQYIKLFTPNSEFRKSELANFLKTGRRRLICICNADFWYEITKN